MNSSPESVAGIISVMQPMLMGLLGLMAVLITAKIAFLAATGEPFGGQLLGAIGLLGSGVVMMTLLSQLAVPARADEPAPPQASFVWPQIGLFEVAALGCFVAVGWLIWQRQRRNSSRSQAAKTAQLTSITSQPGNP